MTELFIHTANNLKLKTYVYDQNKESNTAIIICHGFSGSSSGAFYPQLCELLAKDYFVLRFDFRGQGLSDGKFYDSSLTVELEDLEMVIQYVKKNYSFKNLVLLGHSFGAAVATLFASDNQPDISGLISVSGEGDLQKAAEIEFSPEELKQLKKEGEVQIVNWSKDGKKELLGRQHLTDLEKYSTLNAVKKLKIPILYIHGDKDEVIPLSRTEEMYGLTSSPKAFKVIEGADHVYNVYGNKPLVNDLFAVINSWLRQNF